MYINCPVKVDFAFAYDWQLLAFSIPRIFRDADKIYLFIDKKRASWSGNPYAWNEADFARMIAAMDEPHEIEVVEETFYLPHLDPGHNETRQRKRMFEFIGSNGWHLQLDCDEYIHDFAGFVKRLQLV